MSLKISQLPNSIYIKIAHRDLTRSFFLNSDIHLDNDEEVLLLVLA